MAIAMVAHAHGPTRPRTCHDDPSSGSGDVGGRARRQSGGSSEAAVSPFHPMFENVGMNR